MPVSHLFRTVVATIFIAFAVSTSLAAGPDAAALREFLQTRLFGGTELVDLQFKTFDNGQGAGRVSVAGTVRSIEPLYEESNGLERALSARGFSRDDMHFYGVAIGWEGIGYTRLEAYEVVTPAGSTWSFATEMLYEERVTGFAFTAYGIYGDSHGVPASEIPPKSLQLGSPAFDSLVASYVDARARQEKIQESAVDRLSKVLVGTTLYDASIKDVYDETGRRRSEFILRTGTDLRVEAERPDRLEFSLRGESEWLTDGEWFDFVHKTGEKTLTLVYGSIVLSEEGTPSYSLSLALPDASGEFSITSQLLELVQLNGVDTIISRYTGAAGPMTIFQTAPVVMTRAEQLEEARAGIKWTTFRISSSKKVRFALAENECLQVHGRDIGDNESIQFLTLAGDTVVSRRDIPADTFLAGPVADGALAISEGDGTEPVEIRRVQKVDGAC